MFGIGAIFGLLALLFFSARHTKNEIIWAKHDLACGNIPKIDRHTAREIYEKEISIISANKNISNTTKRRLMDNARYRYNRALHSNR